MFLRNFSFSSVKRFSTLSLKETIKNSIPEKRKLVNRLKKSNVIIDSYSVGQAINGMRGIKSMLWETSVLDPNKGIKFHGYSISDLQNKLPTFDDNKNSEPMPEAMLWLLMTGDIPTKEQTKNLSIELTRRSKLPKYVEDLITSYPKEMHPMTQLSSSILAMQPNSKFVKAYQTGISKDKYWEYVYEDVIEIIAKLPSICSLIYRNKYYDGNLKECSTNLDYAGNFCMQLGFDDKNFHELMRLYLTIHSDHEGGNASAHTCRLVGSTLSDPYLALSASMNALAGPLHGLANQEVLKWLMELKIKIESENKEINKETIEEFAWNTLNNGQVIPGYGHAVLRKTDPRYTCQREFALKHLPDDELFKLVDIIYQVVPEVLLKHGKVSNPYPNVDSHSGVLLNHYGLKEYEFYTVLFGMGRSLGVLSQLVWDRALNLPIERPKSLNTEMFENIINKNI